MTLLLLLLLAAPCRAATDLVTAYRQALAHDALYLSQKAEAEADRREVAKAVSGLVPSVGLTGQASRNATKTTTKDALGIEAERSQYYFSQSYSATLRQPLYRKQNWAQFRQAQAVAARAKASLSQEGESLALRVATAYFEAVLATAQRHVESSRKTALEQMLALTEKAFKSGASTLTDVYEVTARRDLAGAAEIEADNALQSDLMTLQTVMNAPPGDIALIDHAKLPAPDGWGKVEEWIERAEKNNFNLEGLRHDLESARQEKQKALSGHYPTLDLFLTHRRASNEVDVLPDRGTITSLVGVQASLPIFSGGYTWAASAQASDRIERATQRLEAGRREIDLSVRREFGNVRQNASKVAALRQAVVSTEQALLGTQKGVAAGTRTTPDVLNAQDLLFRTQADLERASGQFILSYLRLHEAAGALDEKPLLAVNSWLTASR